MSTYKIRKHLNTSMWIKKDLQKMSQKGNRLKKNICRLMFLCKKFQSAMEFKLTPEEYITTPDPTTASFLGYQENGRYRNRQLIRIQLAIDLCLIFLFYFSIQLKDATLQIYLCDLKINGAFNDLNKSIFTLLQSVVVFPLIYY